MGRAARARKTREQDCLVVKIIHDPAQKRTTAEFTPNDPKLALKVLGAGIVAVSEELEAKKKANGEDQAKPRILAPSGNAVAAIDATRNRGS